MNLRAAGENSILKCQKVFIALFSLLLLLACSRAFPLPHSVAHTVDSTLEYLPINSDNNRHKSTTRKCNISIRKLHRINFFFGRGKSVCVSRGECTLFLRFRSRWFVTGTFSHLLPIFVLNFIWLCAFFSFLYRDPFSLRRHWIIWCLFYFHVNKLNHKKKSPYHAIRVWYHMFRQKNIAVFPSSLFSCCYFLFRLLKRSFSHVISSLAFE